MQFQIHYRSYSPAAGQIHKNQDMDMKEHDKSVKQKVGVWRKLPTANLCTIYILSL